MIEHRVTSLGRHNKIPEYSDLTDQPKESRKKIMQS
jgi:hypothetical protein